MARFRGYLSTGLLCAVALYASEGVVVARTPPTDFFHAGLALLACLISLVNFACCTGLSSIVLFYLGGLSLATSWDARPLPLNAVWAIFAVMAIIFSILSCLCCCAADTVDDEDEPKATNGSYQEHNVKEGKKKKKKKPKAKSKAEKVVLVLILLVFLGAGWFFMGRKLLYMARAKLYSPGPAARAWQGFQPLPWAEAEKKADATLVQMTAPEKYSLLRGSGWPSGIIAGMEPEYGLFTGNTPAIPRLGVPSLNMQDAANGYRTFHDVPTGTTTSWPSLLALGATWDAPLVEEVAAAIAVEFRGKGSNVLLGPSIQVHRTAWGGRNFEYMSGEDPYLGAVLARAYVRGVQEQGVMAVAKHWAFNEQETNRFDYNVNVDRRTAWELYYPPFEAAVEEGVCAFMCAYNRVNGTHSCTNEGILKRDLKEKMGFRGFVQSDWGATYQYSRAVESGLDQDMPGNDNLWTDEALARLQSAAVDEAVRRILATIYRMKLDAVTWCTPPNCIAERLSDQHTPEHQALTAKAAKASLVLLKNDGILPLKTKTLPKIAVVGPPADARCSVTDQDMGRCMNYCGGGSGTVIPGEAVTPLMGITRRAQLEGIQIIPAADPFSITAAVNAAVMADIVVVVGATSATEFIDRDSFSPTLSMSQDVDNMISTVAQYKPTIVLMQTPGPVMMPWLDKVQAVANLFLAGEETGTAWGALLFGDMSPEGKLPVQFPRELKDTIKNDPSRHFEYTEGLFTSYRNPDVEYAFPFGHGLSYTTFELGVPSIVKDDCSAKVCASLTVTNTGERPGREVVQAYMEFEAAVDTPKRIMRGFYKTKVLKPGESEVARFAFTARDLSIFNIVIDDWEVQELAKVHFGASSADIRHVLPLYEPPPPPPQPAPPAPQPPPPAEAPAVPPVVEESAESLAPVTPDATEPPPVEQAKPPPVEQAKSASSEL
mmetsp:Transcript_118176/g.346170  ORF Transcript_118176/g.346170 Transcript_118176/m.346170 type:complete len:941 (-) Transcript_118176:126-2948(-)